MPYFIFIRFIADNAPVRHQVFANNRLSLSLVSSTPLRNIFLLGTGLAFGLLSKIYACLTDPEYGPSITPEKSPFMYSVRDEGLKDFFDYLKHHVRRPTIYIACNSDLIVSSLIRNGLVCSRSLEFQAHVGYSVSAVCIYADRLVSNDG